MTLAETAAYFYQAYHATNDARWYGGAADKEKMDTLSLDEYVADALRENEERWAPGGVEEARDLYAGSTVRAKLSDAEIAVLANKYDPYNMDDAAFDNFLDDLQSMGAISEREKGFLGYQGMTVTGYYGFGGMFIGVGTAYMSASLPDGSSPMLHREEADGDIVRWLSERVLYREADVVEHVGEPELTAYNNLAARRRDAMYENLNNIASRMAKLHPESKRETTDDAVKKNVAAQFADPTSQLYRGLIEKIKDQAREAEEDEREQEVVDALDDVLEGMSERKADGRKPDLAASVAKVSALAQEYDPGDPRRVQLEQAVNQMGRMSIHLHMGGKSSESDDSESETLTQQLIREERENAGPGISDLFGN